MKPFLAITLPMFACVAIAAEPPRFMPKNGYVPDQVTAVKIAEAVLGPKVCCDFRIQSNE